MTEEKPRPKYPPPGALQPDEKTKSQKSLTDKYRHPLVGTLSFKQTKENKTMAEVTTPITPKNPEDAKKEFDRIKKRLVGPDPEWCLPRVNKKAQASSPKIDDLVLNSIICPPLPMECTEVGVD